MAIFDAYIEQTSGYVEEMREKGRHVRELSRASCSADLPVSLPFKVGPGASPGIVMKSDTFLELGSPTTGSCAFALYSDHASLIQDGRVRLIGPDVQESPSATLPFGQVIIAGGETLTDEELSNADPKPVHRRSDRGIHGEVYARPDLDQGKQGSS